MYHSGGGIDHGVERAMYVWGQGVYGQFMYILFSSAVNCSKIINFKWLYIGRYMWFNLIIAFWLLFLSFIFFFSIGVWTTPWATPPAPFICDRFFWSGISQTICLGWLQTTILLISAWVARITGLSHQHLAVSDPNFSLTYPSYCFWDKHQYILNICFPLLQDKALKYLRFTTEWLQPTPPDLPPASNLHANLASLPKLLSLPEEIWQHTFTPNCWGVCYSLFLKYLFTLLSRINSTYPVRSSLPFSWKCASLAIIVPHHFIQHSKCT
jgi:hypothetical protein